MAQSSSRDSRATIAAIATAVGGGIGIVRLSGPRAGEIVGKMCRPWPPKPQSHKLQWTVAYDLRTSERIDEVLAVVMRAPKFGIRTVGLLDLPLQFIIG